MSDDLYPWEKTDMSWHKFDDGGRLVQWRPGGWGAHEWYILVDRDIESIDIKFQEVPLTYDQARILGNLLLEAAAEGDPRKGDYQGKQEQMLKRDLAEFQRRLLEATAGCRPDMHEPDEQELSAHVFGNHLDNAMGSDPNNNCGEFTVVICRDGKEAGAFNLATLIALARRATP